MKDAATLGFGFRPEIEGLRGVAVLLVVLFHAGLPWLPGGFVGVDVFFVISGYLITGLLIAEFEREGRIRLAAFYARRARRLLPGLLLVLFACHVAGMFLLPASGERQAFAMSAIAALGFVSNFFFWQTQSGYFADEAGSLPLLHTWTLAVEEQFYLVWPLLIFALAVIAARKGLGRNRVIGGFVLLAGLSSLAISYVAGNFLPSAAFYLAPARAWEFAAGAALTVVPAWRAGLIHRIPWATIGLVIIAGSAFLFDGKTQWPGIAASAMPVVGAVAIIAGGQVRADEFGVRLLCWKPLRWIGAISYSWYLWHWPVLAFLNVSTLGEASAEVTAAVVLASLLIAAASHHFIEDPIRLQRLRPMAGVGRALGTAASALAVSVLLITGYHAAAQSELRNSPLLQAVQEALRDRSVAIPPECVHYRSSFTRLSIWQECRLGDSAAPDIVVVWGDSHAHHLLPMLDAIAKAEGFGVIPRTRGGCRPFNGDLGTVGIGRSKAELDNCARFNAAVEAELAKLAGEGAKSVLIASRWPPAGEDAPVIPGEWKAELSKSIRAALDSGLRVVLAADLPSMVHNVPACLLRRAEAECERTTPESRRAAVEARAGLEEVAALFEGDVHIWDFTGDLCSGERCRIRDDDGAVLFWDEDHLTVRGALYLAKWQTGPSPFADAIELSRK